MIEIKCYSIQNYDISPDFHLSYNKFHPTPSSLPINSNTFFLPKQNDLKKRIF